MIGRGGFGRQFWRGRRSIFLPQPFGEKVVVDAVGIAVLGDPVVFQQGFQGGLNFYCKYNNCICNKAGLDEKCCGRLGLCVGHESCG